MPETQSTPRPFANSKVLVTSASDYMGPAIANRFAQAGADVLMDHDRYIDDPTAPERIVAAAGHIDVLVLNLHARVTPHMPEQIDEQDWQYMFNALVHPTMRFVKAVLPQMIARRQGKIIAVTSVAPLRAAKAASSYIAARGAQNAYIRSAGVDVAKHNVQINAVAQGFVYGGYPENAMEIPEVREMVMRDLPVQRLAQGWEQAELVLFLASPNSNFIAGQVVPFAGGLVS